MFHSITKSNFLSLAQQHPYVTVYQEFLADTLTPITVLECLSQKNSLGILLESGLKGTNNDFSFIGFQPYATFVTTKGVTTFSTPILAENYQSSPLTLLRQFQQRFHCISDEHSQLAGQMMGFLSYDAIRHFEKLPDQHLANSDLPDILFHFYRINLIFDHTKNKLLLAIVTQPGVGAQAELVYEQAQQEIALLIQSIQQFTPSIPSLPTQQYNISSSHADFATDCSDDQYQEKVKLAKSFISAGDAFQIVLSRTFFKKVDSTPLAIYRTLRYSNPTPYMFYFTTPEYTLLGASPEKLVSLKEKNVTIAPIAGTLPTNQDSETLLTQLLNDKKQCAEHIMLVDLARNDIGSICEPGSVHVSKLMHDQHLTHLIHLVSYVEGKLAKEYDVFDLIKAVFPAGTLSGAPKIRAMEIIDGLENSKRHLYGGAICKIDRLGNLDSCIIIRSGLIQNGMIQIRAGAGIVFDSKPEEESAETRHKALSVMQAVIGTI